MIPEHIIVTPSLSGNIKHNRGPICVGVKGCSNIINARHNSLATALLYNKKLPQIWIDDDIEDVTDKDVEELFRIQKIACADIVVGWYPKRTENIQNPLQTTIYQKYQGYHGDWSEILVSGFGCVLIMPWVWDLFKEYIYTNNGKAPNVFGHYNVFDKGEIGEDYSFFILANKNNLRCVSANNVSLNHHGKRFDINILKNTLSSQIIPEISFYYSRNGDFISNITQAGESSSEIVVLLKCGAKLDQNITEKLRSWQVDCIYPWNSLRFGAANISVNKFCGIYTTPNACRWVLKYIPEKHITFDTFVSLFGKADVAVLDGPKVVDI